MGRRGEHRVEVHLLQHDAVILDLAAGHLFQLADLRDGFRPAVGLHEADRHVDALLPQAVSLLEHFVGLAHAGGEAQVDLQPAALLAANQLKETFRIGMRGVGGH